MIFLSIVSIQTVSAQSQIAYFPPPLQQIAMGVEPANITCTEGLELILKQSNGLPACVKPTSYETLIQRGWGIHYLPDYNQTNNNSEIIDAGTLTVTSNDVNYYNDYTGYLAQPNDDGVYPGIVMIHEWWGLNDNIKQMADDLASEGYVVLAVNLYGVNAATTTDEARELTSSYDKQKGVENMNSAAKFLQENYDVNNLGSIGWCFGGGESLNMALHNEDMSATVIYYGRLTIDESQLSTIDWPVLGIFAGLDQGISVDTVNEFETSLNNLEIENEIYIYPNVEHAFANPSGERYAPDETKDAWKKTVTFLDEHLK